MTEIDSIMLRFRELNKPLMEISELASMQAVIDRGFEPKDLVSFRGTILPPYIRIERLFLECFDEIDGNVESFLWGRFFGYTPKEDMSIAIFNNFELPFSSYDEKLACINTISLGSYLDNLEKLLDMTLYSPSSFELTNEKRTLFISELLPNLITRIRQYLFDFYVNVSYMDIKKEDLLDSKNVIAISIAAGIHSLPVRFLLRCAAKVNYKFYTSKGFSRISVSDVEKVYKSFNNTSLSSLLLNDWEYLNGSEKVQV